MLPVVAIFQLASTGLQEYGARDGKRKGPVGLHRKPAWTKRVRTGARGLELKYSTGSVIDKIICPGIDLDKYRAECVAPLFPDMWNTWRLYKATTPDEDPAKFGDKALAFMTWLDLNVFDGKIRQLGPENIHVGEENPFGTTPILTRQTVCDMPMALEATEGKPPYLSAVVRFVYRGVAQGTPWPAYKITTPVTQSLCPSGARWLLDTVYAPSQEKVPDASKDTILPPYYATHSPSPPSDWSFGTKITIGGGILLAVGLGVAYVVRSFR